MKLIKLRRDAFKPLLFFIIIFVFATQYSCSTTGSTTVVAPEDRIPVVPGEPQKGTWETSNVFLEYEFVKESGTLGLIIDGRTKRQMAKIVLWVLFLDSDGDILERETVFNYAFRKEGTPTPRRGEGSRTERGVAGTLERAFEVPNGTKYLAFQDRINPYTGGF